MESPLRDSGARKCLTVPGRKFLFEQRMVLVFQMNLRPPSTMGGGPALIRPEVRGIGGSGGGWSGRSREEEKGWGLSKKHSKGDKDFNRSGIIE